MIRPVELETLPHAEESTAQGGPAAGAPAVESAIETELAAPAVTPLPDPED